MMDYNSNDNEKLKSDFNTIIECNWYPESWSSELWFCRIRSIYHWVYHTCQISLWSSIKLIIHGTVCQLRDGLVWGSLMERESLEHSSVQSLILQCSAVKIGARSSLCSACCHSTALQFRSLQWWISLLCTLPAGAPWQSFNPVSRWRLTSHQIDGSQLKILQYTQVTHYLEQAPLLHIKLYHFVLSSKLHRFCWFQKLVTMDVLKEVFNPLMALIVGVNP